MALSMVTFNIGGTGTRAEKKDLIGAVLKKHKPSLLLFQENPWRSGQIKKHIEIIKTNYEAVLHENLDATILYRKDVLKEAKSLEGEIKKAFKDIETQNLSFNTFMERASFAKLIERATNIRFIVISWHGEHRGLNDEQKKKKVKDLLKMIKKIQRRTKLPVILGGDFNVALRKVKDSIVDEGFKYYNYKAINRKTIIDFFVVTSDRCRAFEIISFG